jgi:60 kDa SS-A/Ro ribonucleoprotein
VPGHPDRAFLARLAVYSRQRAMMKDIPVALLLALSKRNPALFRQVFDRVVDNGRTLRTLVWFVRSGQFGRKGLADDGGRFVAEVEKFEL